MDMANEGRAGCLSNRQLKGYLEDGKIEIAPLMYMTGRTFKNSYIIADECQNTTPNQMLMLMSRLGEGSKMVITGDISQHDRHKTTSGLADLLWRLEDAPGCCGAIEVVQFDSGDVVRHPVIPLVLGLYD